MCWCQGTRSRSDMSAASSTSARPITLHLHVDRGDGLGISSLNFDSAATRSASHTKMGLTAKKLMIVDAELADQGSKKAMSFR